MGRTLGSGISTLNLPLVVPFDSFPDHRFQDLSRAASWKCSELPGKDAQVEESSAQVPLLPQQVTQDQ